MRENERKMNTNQEFDQMILKTTLTDQEFDDFKRVVVRLRLSLARKTAIFFGICAITVLIAFVYGFVTNAALNQAYANADQCVKRATMAEAQVAQMAEQMKAALAEAVVARTEAEKRLLSAQEKSKATNSKK
jgi:hypothetical protein